MKKEPDKIVKCKECGVVIGRQVHQGGVYWKIIMDESVCTKIGSTPGDFGYLCDKCAGR